MKIRRKRQNCYLITPTRLDTWKGSMGLTVIMFIVISSEGCDTSKILYEVSKIDRGKILRILRILEDSGDSLGIPGDSWGFQGIPKDSWGFLITLWSRNHGDSRDSAGFCRKPWGFSRILWVSRKSVRGFWSVEPLGLTDRNNPNVDTFFFW